MPLPEGLAEVESAELLGFVNGTLSASEELEHETMSAHDPTGTSLCIHSVVIAEPYRRQGLARAMLRQYLMAAPCTMPHLKRVLLICKNNLIPFYESVGFELLGESKVVHGQDKWFDMRYLCPAPAA